MGFQSLWLEDAEAPYAYAQGMGIGKAVASMSLVATLGSLALSADVNVLGPGSMSLVATLGAITAAAGLAQSVIVYQAVWDLVNAGLNVFIVRERSDVIPYDYVISWNPPIGTDVPPYTSVTLTVSDGPVNQPPSTAAIPNVTGLTTWDARAAIFAGGFSLGEYTWAIDSSDAGTVIGQSPAAGTPAIPGTIVTLTVSLGPTQTTPPVPIPS